MRTEIANALTSSGMTVTQSTTLPAGKLIGYQSIWCCEHSLTSILGATQQSQLIAYVQNKGNLYLTAERPCCEAVNAQVNAIMSNLLLPGNNLAVGGLGDQTGPFPFQAGRDHIATRPNNLIGSDFQPAAPGGMANGNTGLSSEPGDRAFIRATGSNNDIGYVFGCEDFVGGVGRAAIVGDINIIGKAMTAEMIVNVQRYFLEPCRK